VFTIVVQDTLNTPKFSGADVALPPPQAWFNYPTGRQVVVLQKTDALGQIVKQAYFYGRTTGLGERPGYSTNARGISVWPVADANGAPDPFHTRIVICGETFDQQVPESQFWPGGWTGVLNRPSGFIAVYNGDLTLLWTRQFFGRSTEGNCAITDVSIRVEFDSNGQPLNDVVTYCGVSSHGVDLVNGVPNPSGSNFALEPFRFFAAPQPSPGQHEPTSGASDNGVDQWDGIVGRVSNQHTGGTGLTASRKFHAVVGGKEQDGLFGIAECEANRLVVVGGSAILHDSQSVPVPGTGLQSFPFTWALNQQSWSVLPDYAVGVVLVFNAAPTVTGGNLVLEASDSLGTVGVPSTIVRDVTVQFRVVPPEGTPPTPWHDAFHMVGSTNDSGLLTSSSSPLLTGTSQTLPGGGTDGFVVSARDFPGNTFVYYSKGTFHGGPGADGLTGVACWPEFPDYIAVAGFTSGFGTTPGLLDVEIASYFVDNTAPVPGQVGNYDRLRRDNVVTALVADKPVVMGADNAFSSRLEYQELDLDSPAGGGIAMEQRGRTNVVGATEATNYPVLGATSRSYRGGQDAMRTAFDILPPGVGRTDLTGLPAGFVPPAPANGGTTPFCALSPFGRQLGRPLPVLSRFLIDWRGPPPAADQTNAQILVDLTPLGTALVGGVMQYGLPDPVPTPATGALEMWVDNNPVSWLFVPNTGALLVNLAQLPPAPFAAAAQFVFFLPTALPCTGQQLAATPALYFSY